MPNKRVAITDNAGVAGEEYGESVDGVLIDCDGDAEVSHVAYG